jgi:hypothetical protein
MSVGWHDHGTLWRSGVWSLERRGDELADIAYSGRRVLRSIRAVVRDRDWNTVEWELEDVHHSDDGTLRISVRSTGCGSNLHGELAVRVAGRRLTVTFHAISHTAFQTNRTGMVVLHPPQTAGSALRVRHTNGTVQHTRFPTAISPHQPVLDIAGLEWDAEGLPVALSFRGDVFEMEDQRNWTDASYKTYSRPLSWSFPYLLAAGENVAQSVEVTVGTPAGSGAAPPRNQTIVLASAGPFPTIGAAASTAPDPEPIGLERIGKELLVELDLRTPIWRRALARAAARRLPLDVRVVIDAADSSPLHALADALKYTPVARVAVFDSALHVSTRHTVRLLRAALAGAGVTAGVVGGSRSHFTELNRDRALLPDDLDELVTTVTPLFHSLSGAQLRESVEIQRLVARQMVGYADGRPVRIGPISLRPRFNNVATATAPQPGPASDDLSEGYGATITGACDPRQRSEQLAAWTVASAAALSVPGVAGLTYFEEWGALGISGDNGTPYPVSGPLRALARLVGATLLSGESPDGLVWALGAVSDEGGVILVANLDLRPRTFTVAAPAAGGHARNVAVGLPALGWDQMRLP